ncbi:MAG: polysaccharide deacetylase family protein [Pirellulales bacterium]|nr:polysaccharide deacetylase family protein [Pirellulales bacterium]
MEPLAEPPIAALSPHEIRDLASMGQHVGCHTMTHPNIAHIGEDALQWEVTESKRILEEILAAPVEHFSYPVPILTPHHTDRTKQVLREAGYKTAVTCDRGVFREGNDPLAIARITVPQDIEEFQWVIENAFLGRTP